METREYIVKRIDGDYAYLILPKEPDLPEKCVARALLPEEIYEGCELIYEMFSYSMK